MRNFASVAVALLMLAVAVPLASGAGAPTYRVVFSGNATEHHVDVQRYVQDTGACNARESIDETAQLGWSTTFSGLTANRGGRPVVAPRPIASMVGGRHVKDACGLALDAAPADWLGESTCDDPLQAIAAPT